MDDVTLAGPDVPVVAPPGNNNQYRYLMDNQGTASLNIKNTVRQARRILDVVKDEAPPHGGVVFAEVP